VPDEIPGRDVERLTQGGRADFNNTTPANDDTNVNIVGRCTECNADDYTLTGGNSSNRPAWTTVAATTSVRTLTNDAARATFIITPANLTVYGAFISSAQGKGSTSGSEVLLATRKFTAARTLEAADEFLVKYTLSMVDSGT
jgi:hypothetical protein